MSSSFDDSFGPDADDSRSVPPTTRPFDDDGYVGYDPRLPSQRFDSFTNFTDTDSVKDSAEDSVPIYAADDAFPPHPLPETPSPNAAGHGGHHFSSPGFGLEANGNAFDDSFGGSDGPILPPPTEMQAEEGFALREWRRLNAIRLEEKEKREKELLNQIIDEADEYKIDFHQRRKSNVETNKNNNKEKEKEEIVCARIDGKENPRKNFRDGRRELTSLSNVRDDARREQKAADESKKMEGEQARGVERKKMKKISKMGLQIERLVNSRAHTKRSASDREEKGKERSREEAIDFCDTRTKAGKPTDLLRMRQILLKLKHETPPHMKLSPAPAQEPAKDAKASSSAPAAVVAPPSTAAPAKAVPVA
ncbi:hypothetical protein Scep_014990 [Stephania cephalantha]|uniref:Clathrin light chain n=1 Tax=Stephania cephalantha TaxID=152367 RepID=A0AAP0P0Z9_9MAGN